MLNIIEGGLSSIARESIKSRIINLTTEKKRVFLLVPEQEALSKEKEYAKLLPECAPLTFEVTNFTRLADSVFRRVGGIANEYSDKAKEALIMWKTLSELSPTLTMTAGRREISYGMVAKALSAYKEMRSLTLTSEDLALLSEKKELSGNARLKNKLSDLSKIMALYKSTLSERFSEAGDDVDALAGKIAGTSDLFSDTVIFISGFTSFTEPQYKVIEELIRICETNIYLSLSKRTEDYFEYSEIKKTKERLIRIADKLAVKKGIIHTDALSHEKNPTIHEASELLFRAFGRLDPEFDKEAIRVFEAEDPYEECDFVASDIKRLIIEGYSPRDFAIVMKGEDKYLGILDVSLSFAKIPFFISKKKDISSFEPIKLIYTAMSAVDKGFSREDVIAYAKCGFCGITREACDEFELYTEKWQITKSQFTNLEYWNMNPDGYTDRSPRDREEILRRINETKDALILPLLKFKDNRSEAKDASSHARALYDFLVDISLFDKIEERCCELESYGELETASEERMLWKIICDSLDTIADTLGSSPLDEAGFTGILKIVFSEASVGRIPSFYDEVTVGSADMLRLRDKKRVYLLGVNHGEFPAAPKERSYFSDNDKVFLSTNGVEIEPECELNYAHELFSFIRAFTSPSESVTLLYSTRNESFSSSARAEVIDRLKEISEGKITPRKISTIPLHEKIYFPLQAISTLSRPNGKIISALESAGYSREISIAGRNIENTSHTLSADTASIIYPDTIALTQSKIDKYVACPLSYYLRYNLNLSENERAEFNARNIGTFVHAILENFFREIKSSEEIKTLTEEKKKSLIESSAKRFLSSLVEEGEISTRRVEILLKRLSNAVSPVVDSLCEELADSRYIPRYFELRIKGENGGPTSPTFVDEDGKKVCIYGSIDRVDTYKNGEDVYVRVIDYKTGTKKFSPSDLDEGKNLQMFLYLKSVVDSKNPEFLRDVGVGEGGRLIPAGVIYVKTEMKDVTISSMDNAEAQSAVKKEQKRQGMILYDDDSISAMNSKFLPVKFSTVTGEPHKNQKKFLYTLPEWTTLMDKIETTVNSISSRMRRGEIMATDKEKDSPCSYCKFKPICRKSKK